MPSCSRAETGPEREKVLLRLARAYLDVHGQAVVWSDTAGDATVHAVLGYAGSLKSQRPTPRG
jgi:hypothetical protein